MCFTETWLTSVNTGAMVDLPGFNLVRTDCDAKKTGKRRGRGIALFANNRWCNPTRDCEGGDLWMEH